MMAEDVLEIVLIVGALWLAMVILAAAVLDRRLGRGPWRKP